MFWPQVLSITIVLAPESIHIATTMPSTVTFTFSGCEADFTMNAYSSFSSKSCTYLTFFFPFFDCPPCLGLVGLEAFVLHCWAKWLALPHFLQVFPLTGQAGSLPKWPIFSHMWHAFLEIRWLVPSLWLLRVSMWVAHRIHGMFTYSLTVLELLRELLLS